MSRFNRHLVPLLSPMLSGESLQRSASFLVNQSPKIHGQAGRLVENEKEIRGLHIVMAGYFQLEGPFL